MSKKRKSNYSDNTTKFGENIPTMFSWLSPDEQRKRADELNNITKSNKKDQEK